MIKIFHLSVSSSTSRSDIDKDLAEKGASMIMLLGEIKEIYFLVFTQSQRQDFF